MKSLWIPIFLAGCSPESEVGAQLDAATQQPADAPGAVNSCGGTGNTLTYSGAVSFDAYDFGMVTSNSIIVGFAASSLNADVLTFNSRTLTDLQALGDHDIATNNLTAMRGPFNTECSTGNTVCHGFYADAGTYTVHAVHPRYQVTFTISNLFDRTDNESGPGAAIAGSITGCVDKDNP
jgi:hypothetical protein